MIVVGGNFRLSLDKTIVNRFKDFRDQIYRFFSLRRDASFELIDSLSGNTKARSVVELSLNFLHRRNYCSITRVLNEYYSSHQDKNEKDDTLIKLLCSQCTAPMTRNYYLFALDCTPNPRRYASTQKDRGFVYAPNTLAGNKPVTIGHQYSIVVCLPEKYHPNTPPWVVPVSCRRVTTDEKSALVGMQQISQCIRSNSTLKETLCVSVADSSYSHAETIFESSKNSNQVHISRLRSNRVLYYPAESETRVKIGRKKRFGDPFRLNDDKTHHTPDETLIYDITTQKGKKHVVKIACWNHIVMRGTHQSNLSTTSFRLLSVRVYQELGEPLFKNKLLLNKLQTPEVIHEEVWWQLCMVAYTQLYLARELAQNIPSPWGKYLPSNNASIRSPSQVQKDFERIISTIGTPAQPPKPLKKAFGRKKGDTQTKRTRYAIVIKNKKTHPVAILK